MISETTINKLRKENVIVDALLDKALRFDLRDALMDVTYYWHIQIHINDALEVFTRFNSERFQNWASFQEFRRNLFDPRSSDKSLFGDIESATHEFIIPLSIDHYRDEVMEFGYGITDVELFADVDSRLFALAKSRMEAMKDPAHRWEHINDVAWSACRLAEHLSLDVVPLKIAAMIHDLFTEIDRDNHHTRAGEWARENLSHYGYNATVTELVATACDEHRASRKEESYSNIYSEVFAAADRGISLPVSINSLLTTIATRAFQVASHKNPELPYLEVSDKACAHVKEKYGSEGYAQWPNIAYEYCGDDLKRMKLFIDQVTPSVFTNLIDPAVRNAEYYARFEKSPSN